MLADSGVEERNPQGECTAADIESVIFGNFLSPDRLQPSGSKASQTNSFAHEEFFVFLEAVFIVFNLLNVLSEGRKCA